MSKLGDLKVYAPIGAALVVFVVVTQIKKHRGQHHDTPLSPAEIAANAARAKADEEAAAEHGKALDSIIAARIAPTDEACPVRLPRSPVELGQMNLAWPGDLPAMNPGDDTPGYLMYYLRLTGSDVEVAPAPGSGAPFERTGFGVAAATLIIDRWQDPVLPIDVDTLGKFYSGHIDGRLVVWDPATKSFVCVAAVSAGNTNVTVVSSTDETMLRVSHEDKLSKVRIDLINEAIRAGLDAPPKRLGDLAAAEAKACADGKGKTAIARVIVDLRGTPAERIENVKFLGDVKRALARRKVAAVERIWLFDAHTFDVWDPGQLTDGLTRWSDFLLDQRVDLEEVVISDYEQASQGLIRNLQSMGFIVYGDDAKLCVDGTNRAIVDVAGSKGTGVRVVEIPIP